MQVLLAYFIFTGKLINDSIFTETIDRFIAIESLFIGNNAFKNYERLSLTSITLPNGLVEFGAFVFCGCTSLIEFKVDSQNTNYCTIDGVLFSYDKTILIEYPGGKKGDCVIPDGITITNGAFTNCIGLTSITLPNGLREIGYSAFEGCTSLTSITLPDGVTNIGTSAFEGCTQLTMSPIFPNNLATIDDYAFKDCTNLTSVVLLPNGLKRLGNYHGGVFENCTSLTSIIFPKDVEMREDRVGILKGCKNLKEVYICTSKTFMGYGSSIEGCKVYVPYNMARKYKEYYNTEYGKFIGLYNYSESTYKTTSTLRISEKGNIDVKLLSDSIEYNDKGNTIKVAPQRITETSQLQYDLKDLSPNQDYLINMKVKIKGVIYDTDFFIQTQNIIPTVTLKNVGQTTAILKVQENVDDATLTSKTIIYYSDYQNQSTTKDTLITNLSPNTEYSYICHVQVKETNDLFSSTWQKFTTKNITFTSQPADAISNTSVTLNADLDCDAESGYGFEWRKYDAPNMVPSNTVQAEKIKDKIAFRLINLSPSTYYKYRPFYKSASEKMYYGEWIAFGTADVPVLFAPTVETLDYGLDKTNETNVIVYGYVLAGSESILQQGFEYWIAFDTNHKEVLSSRTNMEAEITGLLPNTTYKYRAFAKTASGTTYGEESELTTGKASGIESNKTTDFQVSLYPNPAQTETVLQISGAETGIISYTISDLNGRLLLSDKKDANHENYIPINTRNLSERIYIIRVIHNDNFRTIKMEVK